MSRLFGVVVFIVSLGIASSVQAAAQVLLGKVNTSVTLTKANAVTTQQKWQLQTDPSDPDFDNYIPIDGMIDNSFDPTKFALNTNPNPNPDPVHNPYNFSLGYTVMGLGAYQVLGAHIDMSGSDNDGGGYFDIEVDPSNPLQDKVTDVGDVSGDPTGVVEDIHYSLIASDRDLALPASQDQLFCQVNLIQLDPSPDFDPGIAKVYAGPDSYLTVTPSDPGDTSGPIMTSVAKGADFETTSTPEPVSAAILGMAAFGLLGRRRNRAAAR